MASTSVPYQSTTTPAGASSTVGRPAWRDVSAQRAGERWGGTGQHTGLGLAIACWLTFIAGCDGCRRPAGPEDAAQDGGGVAAEFSFRGPQPMPHGANPATLGIKPGHWFTVGESLTSNLADRRGAIRHQVGAAGKTGGEVIDETGIVSPARPDRWLPLIAESPAVLPRQRSRRVDTRLIASSQAPYISDGHGLLMGQFATGSASTLVETGRRPVSLLEPEEYFLVVLSRRPERFAGLQTADWVRSQANLVASSDQERGASRRNYRLVLMNPEGWPALPETMLDWTSTSALLWDDVEPATLTPEQWRALIDWLHFGGRLIVNGPAMGGELSRDRLATRMPQRITASEELDMDAVAGLVRDWSVEGDATSASSVSTARQRTGRVATAGPIDPRAVAVPNTHGLAWTMAVGRGQVVQTRFDLTADWVNQWRSRDSFYNGAILGRPRRQFSTLGKVAADRDLAALDGLDGLNAEIWEARYPELGMVTVPDARFNTRVRILARDAKWASRPESIGAELGGAGSDGVGSDGGRPADASSESDRESDSNEQLSPADRVAEEAASEWLEPEFTSDPIQGIAGWRDDSDFARAAVDALRAGAGVAIPSRTFVIRSLAGYLAVLVPLNFALFWLIGRLEWAWLAVPAIGLIGALWVARQANLDIGFARSQTEINLIEAHAGYPRAHVTRFMSIYNSLSRSYDLAFDSPDGVAAPLGLLGQVDVGREDLGTVTLRYGTGQGPVLAAVPVASNRARIFHLEQVVDLGGAIVIEGNADDSATGNPRLRNGSQLDLKDAIVITRDERGMVRVAEVGELAAGSTRPWRWRDPGSISGNTNWRPKPAELGVERLLEPLAAVGSLPPGSARLVALSTQAPSGLVITPEAAQQTRATIVVVHLRLPAPPTARPDLNLPPEASVAANPVAEEGATPTP